MQQSAGLVSLRLETLAQQQLWAPRVPTSPRCPQSGPEPRTACLALPHAATAEAVFFRLRTAVHGNANVLFAFKRWPFVPKC